MSSKRDDRKTARGYAVGGEPPSKASPKPIAPATVTDSIAEPEARPVLDAKPPDPPALSAAAPAAPETLPRTRGTPAIELDLVYERRSAPAVDRPWQTVEIWTQHRVYALDASLVCIDVYDQATKQSEPKHPMIGARLVGGQLASGEAVELSYPFPRPGSDAVFEQVAGRNARFSQTSTVTRVVLRLRVLTVAPSHTTPTWEELTGAVDVPTGR